MGGYNKEKISGGRYKNEHKEKSDEQNNRWAQNLEFRITIIMSTQKANQH
jgi:hypothetical protein